MTDNSTQPQKRHRTKDIVRAAKSGDRLETLIALRDLLAERLKTSDSDRDIASMSRRLMQCVEEIEELQKELDAKNDRGARVLKQLQSFQTLAASRQTDEPRKEELGGSYWPKKA